MSVEDTRKAGQALGAFLKKAGTKVAFDVGTGLTANALMSKLQPQVNQMIAPMGQQTMTQAIDPEQQAMPGNYADLLHAKQHQDAAAEHQRYLYKLSLIQAEKQPTTVVHQNRQDLVAAQLAAMQKIPRYI